LPLANKSEASATSSARASEGVIAASAIESAKM
jgi:hypothetical protein